MHLSEQEIIRRNKLIELKKLGINPYPAEEFKITTTAEEINKIYKEGKIVRIAGRLMSIRIMGKASFAEIQDHTGKIQIYTTNNDLIVLFIKDKKIEFLSEKESYNTIFKKLLDIGDFIGIEGILFKTKKHQISIHVKHLSILSKSLRPLPVVKIDEYGNIYDKLSDTELRYRMRYVDLTVNSQVKNILLKRTLIFQSMRNYFNSFGYIEVETPILQSIPGGANAKPFTTYHNALNIPLYLRISNELYLKRLIVGGFNGVYEFSKNFRNEGIDRMHNPEFTAMEIYISYKDYYWMMKFTENLLEHVAITVNKTLKYQFKEHKINWKAPYPRISITDAIEKFTGFNITGKTEESIRKIAKSMGININKTMDKGKLIDEIFELKCEQNFIQPTFIIDYPVEISPLAKKHRNKTGLTERFELIVCGKEIANSYSELNDPIDQKYRFEYQLQLSEKGDNEAMRIDNDFLHALEYGMPPTAGLGIGMDRLTMLLTNTSNIQEVLFFPQMKPNIKINQSKCEK